MDAYELAEQFATETNQCLFITGKAGTGKTTFLRRLHEITTKNMAIVAPTGVAAINAGGVTIHSFFQLPIRTLLPTPSSHKQIFAEQRMTSHKRNLLYHLELLVIDEISMVRADVLDAIDAVLRHYKYRPRLPFGGVQVIFIGDLFQLSPVVRGEDEMQLNRFYDGPYFFQSNVMRQLRPLYIELDHVFRQQNLQFVHLLNEVRENSLTPQSEAQLNTRYIPNFKNREDDFHITLTTHNLLADSINRDELQKVETKAHHFTATIRDNFPESAYPAEYELVLKVGARVMFIRNDDEKPRRFYNGKTGIITAITHEGITVDCGDEEPILTNRMTWENIRYREEPMTGKITEEVLGTFTQYPLRLAWAITIHKSQGLTFEKVIIDAARAFAAGQVYVALSRCRSLEGLVLSSPLGNSRIQNDTQVLQYTNSQPTIEQVSNCLQDAQTEYRLQLLGDIFDMQGICGQADQLRTIVLSAVSFNKSSLPFTEDLLQQFTELLPVGEKFYMQLRSLVLAGDEDKLRERLSAADSYFKPRLKDAIEQIEKLPVRSKNKDDANEYLRTVTDLHLTLCLKRQLMRAVTSNPTTDNILRTKATFFAPALPFRTIYTESLEEIPARKKSKRKKQIEKQSNSQTDEQTNEILQKYHLEDMSDLIQEMLHSPSKVEGARGRM